MESGVMQQTQVHRQQTAQPSWLQRLLGAYEPPVRREEFDTWNQRKDVEPLVPRMSEKVDVRPKPPAQPDPASPTLHMMGNVYKAAQAFGAHNGYRNFINEPVGYDHDVMNAYETEKQLSAYVMAVHRKKHF